MGKQLPSDYFGKVNFLMSLAVCFKLQLLLNSYHSVSDILFYILLSPLLNLRLLDISFYHERQRSLYFVQSVICSPILLPTKYWPNTFSNSKVIALELLKTVYPEANILKPVEWNLLIFSK